MRLKITVPSDDIELRRECLTEWLWQVFPGSVSYETGSTVGKGLVTIRAYKPLAKIEKGA